MAVGMAEIDVVKLAIIPPSSIDLHSVVVSLVQHPCSMKYSEDIWSQDSPRKLGFPSWARCRCVI